MADQIPPIPTKIDLTVVTRERKILEAEADEVVLPATDGFVRKVKPLIRLSERETAAYCVLKGIDYIVEECPNAVGNKHLGYKDALNTIEDQSPGSKAAFYFGFLARAAPKFTEAAVGEREELHPCPSCGAPTTAEVCAFCKLVNRATNDTAANGPVARAAPQSGLEEASLLAEEPGLGPRRENRA